MALLRRPVVEAARAVIGAELLVAGVGGTIVEAEAYARDDPASHSFRGPTPRTAAMFAAPGHAYVYLSYGMHWCLNLCCGEGNAVLLRALHPGHGLDAMRARRGPVAERDLCRGPGRLCQALGVTLALNGGALWRTPFSLRLPEAGVATVTGVRVGITRAVEQPWRFGMAGSRWVSRGFPAAL